MNDFPFVSIIIPCRNEEKYIGKCLDSVISQDFPKENLEVLAVNGASADKTKEIVQSYAAKYPFIKLLENPKKYTSFGLNIGLKASRGAVILRMDSHAGYEKDYISKCVKYLKEYDADNVGGVMKTLPSKKTIFARAIAISLSHPFGAGGSYFRTGSAKPRWVDTVFGGCYKREVFNKIGLFNENLLRSQDMEFNLRLKKAGGKILLVPDIINHYYPKSNPIDFLKHNFSDGIWAIYPLKFGANFLSFRHFIPLIFVLTLPVIVWPYLVLSLLFSLIISIKNKDARLFFVMPVVFGIRHLAYGAGSLRGLVKLIED